MSTSSLADALYERLLRSFPADQAYTPADWEADVMPSPVRHYLTHLLRHHRRREARHLRRARTNWVNYDHPEMERATRTFLDAAEDHVQVPQDQWTDTLRTATQRTTDYLVRPVPTLTSFVFETSNATASVSQIQWRMRFLEPYAYLRNAIEAYAEKRDRESFKAEAFERILRRVDERMTADFDADRWLRLLDPLFEMAYRATGRKQVSSSLLRTFFEEKNASRLVDRLATHERDSDTISPDTLRHLLEGTATEPASDRHDAAAAPPAEPPLDPALPDPADPPNFMSSSEDRNSDEATPMWKQFEQNRSRRSAETTEDNQESQPLWTQFQKRKSPPSSDTDATSSSSSPVSSPSETSPTGPTRDSSPSAPESSSSLSALEQEVFGANHSPNRTVYIRELFQGDENAYRRLLERLHTTESWSVASQIIARDVFRANQVNIYSDTAIHFTDGVEASFKN